MVNAKARAAKATGADDVTVMRHLAWWNDALADGRCDWTRVSTANARYRLSLRPGVCNASAPTPTYPRPKRRRYLRLWRRDRLLRRPRGLLQASAGAARQAARPG
jgi:hypothetical protein